MYTPRVEGGAIGSLCLGLWLRSECESVRDIVWIQWINRGVLSLSSCPSDRRPLPTLRSGRTRALKVYNVSA